VPDRKIGAAVLASMEEGTGERSFSLQIVDLASVVGGDVELYWCDWVGANKDRR